MIGDNKLVPVWSKPHSKPWQMLRRAFPLRSEAYCSIFYILDSGDIETTFVRDVNSCDGRTYASSPCQSLRHFSAWTSVKIPSCFVMNKAVIVGKIWRHSVASPLTKLTNHLLPPIWRYKLTGVFLWMVSNSGVFYVGVCRGDLIHDWMSRHPDITEEEPSENMEIVES